MIDLDGKNGLEDLIDSDVGICEGVIALPKSLVKELITRLRQAEKDAARYRWLRCQHDKEDDTVSIFINDEQHGAGHLDSQVDEAMNVSNN